MKQVILKYGLNPPAFNQEFKVAMREGAEPFAVQVQERDPAFAQVWATCSATEAPVVFYKFFVANTGTPFEKPEKATYLGTVQRGDVVGHVFYALPDSDSLG